MSRRKRKRRAKISGGKTTRHEPWYNWSGAVATFRLSFVLVLAAILFMPVPIPARYQVLGLAVILCVYIVAVSAVELLLAEGQHSRRPAGVISIIMLLFVIATAFIFRQESVALLVLIPVINAALRMSGRNLVGVVLLAGISWLGLHMMSGLPTLEKWPEILAGLLPLGLVAVIVRSLRGDIDLARNRLTALSYQDELSGALNMRAFTRLHLSAHARAVESGASYALLMIDIENLQLLNEKYGHEQGNRVIVAVAEALKRSIRTDDFIARYGGDEFIVYLSLADDSIAQQVSNRMSQNVYNITLSFERNMQRVQINVGTAIYPDSGKTIQEMMAFADKAMYRDKDFRRRTKPTDSSGDTGRAQAGIENA
jgi:diguanylate cyclase (GGDEF)-like protein